MCSRGQTHPAQHRERTGNKAKVLDDRELSLLEKETKGALWQRSRAQRKAVPVNDSEKN